MNDTQIVDEILHKLKSANAGHFDRTNLLDSLDKIDFGIDAKDKEVEDLKYEIQEIRDTVKDVIDKLEWI